jgi:hypothetical protein
MKARRLAAGIAILTVMVVGLGVGPAVAEERVCGGTIGAVTVDNLRVPQQATCRLQGTIVQGTIKVEHAARLVASAVRVIGNVQAEGAASVTVASSRVGGRRRRQSGVAGRAGRRGRRRCPRFALDPASPVTSAHSVASPRPGDAGWAGRGPLRLCAPDRAGERRRRIARRRRPPLRCRGAGAARGCRGRRRRRHRPASGLSRPAADGWLSLGVVDPQRRPRRPVACPNHDHVG